VFVFVFALVAGVNDARAEWFAESRHKNAVEGSVLLPFFPGNELLVKYTRELWRTERLKGELVLGVHAHIRTDRDGGTYDDVQVPIGYRQYLLHNLHVEAAVQPKLYYRFENGTYAPNQTFEGLGLYLYAMAGYRIDVWSGEDVAAFVMLQPVGVGYSAYATDDWPKAASGRTRDTPVYMGNIAVGVRF